MAQIPEYQRSQGIEPQAGPVGMGQALGNVASAKLDFGSIGASIAQNSSIEMAQITARQAALTPGRKLIPGFTEADKAFVQTYQQEELFNLSLEAEKIINGNKLDALRNPTPDSLALYQKNTLNGLQKLNAQVSEVNRHRFQQEMNRAYQMSLLQVEAATKDSNFEYLKDLNNARLDQNSRDLKDASLTGDFDTAREIEKRSKEEIDSLEEQRLISPREANNQRLKIELGSLSDQQSWEFQEAEKNGMGNEYLAWLAEQKGDSFKVDGKDGNPSHTFNKRTTSPTMQLEANHQTLQFATQYRAMSAGQKNVRYLQGVNAISEGTMDLGMLEDMQTEVTPQQFEQLKNLLIKRNAKANQAQLNFLTIDGIKTDQVAMSGRSSQEIEEYFNTRVAQREAITGKQATIQEKADIAEEIQAPVKGFTNLLGRQIQFGTTPQALESLQQYRRLSNNNPISISGMPSDAVQIGEAYNARADVMGPEEAVIGAREKIGPVDASQRESLSNQVNDIFKLNEFGNPVRLRKFTADAMGISSSDVIPGLDVKFSNLVRDFYFQTRGDWDSAVNQASQRLNQVYGYSSQNGSKQFSFAPVEKYVPYGDSGPWVRNQFILDAQNVFERQKKGYDLGVSSWYYEFEEGQVKQVSNPLQEPMWNTKFIGQEDIKVVKVTEDENGNKVRVPGILVMNSDNGTVIPQDGRGPNYGMYVRTDNGPEIVFDPQLGEDVRFTPSLERFSRYLKTPQEKIENYLLEQEGQTTKTQDFGALLRGVVGS